MNKTLKQGQTKTKKSPLKKAINIVIDVLFGLILVLGAYVTINAIVTKCNNGVPNVFGYAPLSVQSESMTGTFNKGDLIFSKLLSFSEEGDPSIELVESESVVTFRYDIDGNGVKELVTHQYVARSLTSQGYLYEFVGTYNPTGGTLAHQYVYQGDVVGVYTGVCWAGWGNFSDFLNSPTGFMIIVMIPIIAFFIYATYKLIRVLLEGHNEKKLVTENKNYDDMKEKMRQEILAELSQQNKGEEKQEKKKEEE